jgi:DNA-binding NarL/FixJ family response regulator
MTSRVSKPIEVSIVEDDSGIRSSLARMIDGAPGFHCLEAYPDAETALAEIPARPPDVVLMDINLPGLSGIECVRQLKAQAPDLRVVMLTVYDDSDLIFRSLMAGADGYLLKRTSREKLLDSLTEITSGGAPMSRQIARRVIQYFHEIAPAPVPADAAPEVKGLTERETEILANLAKGYSYKEISSALGISVETVRSHIRHTYEKLHVHSRTQAILKYLGKTPA